MPGCRPAPGFSWWYSVAHLDVVSWAFLYFICNKHFHTFRWEVVFFCCYLFAAIFLLCCCYSVATYMWLLPVAKPKQVRVSLWFVKVATCIFRSFYMDLLKLFKWICQSCYMELSKVVICTYISPFAKPSQDEVWPRCDAHWFTKDTQ